MSFTADIFENTIKIVSTANENIFYASWTPYEHVVGLMLSFFLFFSFAGMLYGKFNKTFFLSILLFSVIWTGLSEFSLYYGFFCKPFLNLSKFGSCFVIEHISGGDINTPTQLFIELDNIGNKLWHALLGLVPTWGGWKLLSHNMMIECGLLLVALLYLATYAAFFAIFTSTIVMQFVLFMVGPLFIVSFAFPKTRFLAFNWFKAQFTFSLTCIMSAIFMGLNLWIFDNVTDHFAQLNADDPIFTPEYMGLLVVLALAFYLVLKAPSVASSLTGGQADSTGGLGMAIMAIGGAGAGAAAKLGSNKLTQGALGKVGGGAKKLGGYGLSKAGNALGLSR